MKNLLHVFLRIGMRTALSWIITRGEVVLYYRRFGTTYRSLNPEDGVDKFAPKRR